MSSALNHRRLIGRESGLNTLLLPITTDDRGSLDSGRKPAGFMFLALILRLLPLARFLPRLLLDFGRREPNFEFFKDLFIFRDIGLAGKFILTLNRRSWRSD